MDTENIELRGHSPRIGIVGYTNFASGIGLLVYDLWKNLGDSILSVDAGIKGQEVWTERQVTATRPPSGAEMTEYFERFSPEAVIFIETPFAMGLYEIAHRHGCKTVGIPMHETYHSARLRPDLLICPCYSAYEKAEQSNVKLLFLPIDISLFPFHERTGHTFVMNIGYGGPHDRRQAATVIKAFQTLGPEARMIVRCQQDFPPGVKVDDSRITYFRGTLTRPHEVYEQGDIYLAPMAYGGFERPILEAMASGMPTLTTNADPMNLFQHDSDFLIEPCRKTLIKSTEWVVNTIYNEVSVESLAEKLRWLTTIDTAKYSRRARKQAEAQSWESTDIDYRKVWLEAIGSIL